MLYCKCCSGRRKKHIDTFFEFLRSAATWIGILIAALYAYRTVYVILGLFTTRKYPPAKHRHRYGIVIAARNEEKVIGHLLDSIRGQDYPAELLSIFVVADNCTDATAAVARKHGAVCYERFDPDHCTKGYALEYLFECIERDFGRTSFDGYFVFDADNLLQHDYISRMNEAFDAGTRIVTSYRNTKNFDANWISYSYGIHWLGTVRTEHRARSYLGLSTRLQGTGYLFDAALVQDGWHFTSLTEDRQLTADAVCRGWRIGYQHDAVFYDEQPIEMRIAMRQRLRWARGNLLVFRRNWGQLLRTLFGRLPRPGKGRHNLSDSFVCYDILLTVFPETLLFVLQKLLLLISEFALVLLSGATRDAGQAMLWALAVELLRDYISRLAIPVYTTLIEHRRMPSMPWYKKLIGCLLWPIFPLIGDVSILLVLFCHIEWKPIPHSTEISIEQLQQKRSE